MAAAILPTLNLHWLPSILANPNITLSPAQVSALASHPAAIQSTAPVNVYTGATYGGSSYSSIPVGKTIINLPQAPSTSFIGQSNIYRLFPQETPHFESEVRGGSEKDETGVIAENVAMDFEPTVITPAGDIIPSTFPVIPTIQAPNPMLQYGAVTDGIREEKRTRKKEDKYASSYAKEVEEIISPKGIIFNITIGTVILSAFVFIAILAWFEVLRTWYDQTFDPVLGLRNVETIFIRFWYAFFVTCLVIILVYILHRWSKSE